MGAGRIPRGGRLLHDQRIRHHPAAARRIRPYRPGRHGVVLLAKMAPARTGAPGPLPVLHRTGPHHSTPRFRRGLGLHRAVRHIPRQRRPSGAAGPLLQCHVPPRPCLVPRRRGAVLPLLAAAAGAAPAPYPGADRTHLDGSALSSAGPLALRTVEPERGAPYLQRHRHPGRSAAGRGAARPGHRPAARRRPPAGRAQALVGTAGLARAGRARPDRLARTADGRQRLERLLVHGRFPADGGPVGRGRGLARTQAGRPLARLLSLAPLAWTGRNLSYGLYLWHYPLGRLLSDLGVETGLLAATLTVSFAAAIASHYAIERPLARHAGRFRARTAPAPVTP